MLYIKQSLHVANTETFQLQQERTAGKQELSEVKCQTSKTLDKTQLVHKTAEAPGINKSPGILIFLPEVLCSKVRNKSIKTYKSFVDHFHCRQKQ